MVLNKFIIKFVILFFIFSILVLHYPNIIAHSGDFLGIPQISSFKTEEYKNDYNDSFSNVVFNILDKKERTSYIVNMSIKHDENNLYIITKVKGPSLMEKDIAISYF